MSTKTSPITFLKQVRAEAAKVVWPTRRETVISTISVFIMVFLVALFLFAADRLVQYAVWGVIDFFEHLLG